MTEAHRPERCHQTSLFCVSLFRALPWPPTFYPGAVCKGA